MQIEYNDRGDTAHSLIEYKGIRYWSLITPSDIQGNSQCRTIEDIALLKNSRAKILIDQHLDMCRFFKYTPYQGEYRERNGWHSSDKCFFGLYINKWEHGQVYWESVRDASLEDFKQYRKSQQAQLELFD